MFSTLKQNAELLVPPTFIRTPRRLLVAFSVGFILLTLLYCYFYAFYVGTDYRETFFGTLACVSIDWAGWIVVAPFITFQAAKQNLRTRTGRLAILRLAILAVLVVGLCRMLIEYSMGTGSFIQTLIYFLPRYLFMSSFLIGIGIFFVYKNSADREIQALKLQQSTATEEDEQLVAYKGTCRAMVRCKDIISVTASGNYLELETPTGIFLMRNTMKEIETKLDPKYFVRIHRSHIVNLNELESVSHSRLEAKLTNGKVLRIGKKYLHSLPHFA